MQKNKLILDNWDKACNVITGEVRMILSESVQIYVLESDYAYDQLEIF